MTTVTTYSWGTVLRTRIDDRQSLLMQAADLIEDAVMGSLDNDEPTRERMSTPHKPFHLTKKVRTY